MHPADATMAGHNAMQLQMAKSHSFPKMLEF